MRSIVGFEYVEGHAHLDVEPIDVRFKGLERVICCWQVGDVLVDPGPESSLPALLDALGDVAPARAAADAHPPRPRRRDGRARAALARPRGLRARARRAARDRSLEAAGERRTPLRRGEHEAAVGRGAAGAGRARARAERAASAPARRRRSASPTRPATPPTTSATCTRTAARAFVGDMAGVRIPPADVTIAPTPPPDIDVEAWEPRST